MSAASAVAFALAAVLTACAVWTAGDPFVWAWVRAQSRRLRALRDARDRGVFDRRGRLGALANGFLARLPGMAVLSASCRGKPDDEGRCLDELPELIDVVALGLSAGISFDAALEIYCEHYRTGLSRELGDAMRSWRLGVSTRKEALRALAARMKVGAFSTFVETVTESLQFGAPLVKNLTGQADAVRRSRRAVVEERIEKAPVKMLVPTGGLVLPAMLLAILGPILASLTTVVG